ncbi:MAG: hypothetical protein JSR59_05820 [Proteobacteria bacterium]|nr:hypothetical protein [Pseudomonadota bacterium]
MNAKLAAVLLLPWSLACLAAEPRAEPPAAAPAQLEAASAPLADASAPEPRQRPEPAVRHVIVEDDGARIEELNVRGVTREITVTPKIGKVPLKSYEIITTDGSRDLGPGANTSRGAAGKRVWSVLQF